MPSRRPEVVRLITRLNIGGPARQALLLTKELDAQWPTLLGAGTPNPEEGELSEPDVRVHHLPLVRPVRPVTDMQAFVQVRRLLHAHQPKLVHTHMAKAGLIGRLASIGSRIRTIHTYHGHVLSGYFRKPVQRAFLEVERRLASKTDVLVAISPEIRDELLDLRIGTSSQYEVIPLGFDLTEHLAVREPSGELRASIGIRSDVPLVGIVGRLVPVKDLTTLLRAAARLPGVHVAIVGDGDSRPGLVKAAAELGIGDRTHFTGWWKDVAAAMSDFDVVALTSRNEGTPVSLIEASACARPIVATDVGGVRFVVRDGETGLLCPPQDHAAIAAALQKLLLDRVMATRLATAARARVRDRFHKDRLVADISSLYRDVCNTTSRFV